MVTRKYNKSYNGSQDKDILPNKGMDTKKIKIGKHEDTNLYLECTIEEIDLSTQAIYNGEGVLLYVGNTKETMDHKKISKYRTLSISGYGKYMAGQIYDSLFKYKDIKLDDSNHIKQIVKIWEEWHLNDTVPNCIHQDAFNCNVGNFTELAAEQTKKCPKGYRYGSKWLVKDLPLNIQEEIIRLFCEVQ